jgi:hypothetical protein
MVGLAVQANAPSAPKTFSPQRARREAAKGWEKQNTRLGRRVLGVGCLGIGMD